MCLQRAAATGDNLIVTHEPAFYGHMDETAALAQESDTVPANGRESMRARPMAFRQA